MGESAAQENADDAISFLQKAQFEPGGREARELAILPRILDGCDRFIDLGANLGQYTHFANKHLSGAEILAIEPNAQLRKYIEANFASADPHGERQNQLTVVSCAISDRAENISFYLSDRPDRSTMFASIERGARVIVPAQTLDSFYRESRKTIIKFDIEGAEYRALMGADRFLKSNHCELYVELHQWGDPEISKFPINVCNLLFAKGYACRRIYHRYYFYRASLLERSALYILVAPHLLLLSLPYRYPKIAKPVKALHKFLAWIRRSIVP